MKVISLQVSNLMKLVAVEIVPTTNLVKITGRNEQGKTSILNALFMALGGADCIPDKPVRRGQKKGSVKVDLGDIIVTRTFTEAGTTSLVIENRDGLVFKSPQTLLNTLVGRLSFDPLEFVRQEGAKQLETLRQITGLDFRKLDIEREQLYRKRTEINREVVRLKSAYDTVVVPSDAPTEEVDASAIMARVQEAIGAQKIKNDAMNKIARVEQAVRVSEAHRTDTDNEIQALQKQIESLRLAYTQSIINTNQLTEELGAARQEHDAITIPDVDAIRAEVATVEETNKLVARV